jgi:hypothetical protein
LAIQIVYNFCFFLLFVDVAAAFTADVAAAAAAAAAVWVGWLGGWLVGWLVGWVVGGLVGWLLVGCCFVVWPRREKSCLLILVEYALVGLVIYS